MANWKKVVVSGSNVSQLNNDAGYLTAGTLQVPNLFNTASFNGTNLLADSQSGSLNFASSSGQGLTITANAGTDTLTFGLSAIPNNSLANSTITIAGTSTSLGGSITQATILAGSGVFSGSAQVTGLTNANLSGTAGITNANLANSSVTVGSTNIALGATSTTLAGLTSVSSTAFTGSLQGTASFASTVPYSGITGVPAGIVSGSSQISYSGITGVPANIVSASVLSSPLQGQALLTTNGVAGSTIDLGLEAGDSPTFAGVTAGNVTVGVSNDNTITTSTGDLTVTSAGGNVTISNNLVVTNNLTVQGTASFQNTTNLEVADRFILMASGSNTTGDGGIVVQQATQNVGELFGYDSGASRWGVTGSFTASGASYTPDAFMAAAVIGTGAVPTGAPARYQVAGNIFIGTDEGIWIYS